MGDFRKLGNRSAGNGSGGYAGDTDTVTYWTGSRFNYDVGTTDVMCIEGGCAVDINGKRSGQAADRYLDHQYAQVGIPMSMMIHIHTPGWTLFTHTPSKVQEARQRGTVHMDKCQYAEEYEVQICHGEGRRGHGRYIIDKDRNTPLLHPPKLTGHHRLTIPYSSSTMPTTTASRNQTRPDETS